MASVSDDTDATTGISARPDEEYFGPLLQISRAAHVGARGEHDIQVAAATDGLAAHARDADDGADRFFERPRDLNFHVDEIEAGLLGHDCDARKRHFGIYAAGHARNAVDAPHRQKCGGQDDSAQVGTCFGSDVEHGKPFGLRVKGAWGSRFSAGPRREDHDRLRE